VYGSELTLSLFVARVAAYNPQAPSAAHVSTMHANFFDRRFHFHGKSKQLHSTYDSSPPSIRIELKLDTIADEHFYPVQTHFTGKVRKRDLTAIELNPKECVRKRLVDGSFHKTFFSHICVC
jgi:hypothetical protein